MAKWFEHSEVRRFRLTIKYILEKENGLPPTKNKKEKAATFWWRVETAGLLEKALDLYDTCAEKAKDQAPRETKKMFAERIAREGRQTEVEEARDKLMADGYPLREIHAKLVERFQPLDGSKTRAWKTPDPWKAGRLFRRKEDQDKLLAESNGYDHTDYCPKNRWRFEWEQMHEEKRLASERAKQRMECAEWRREERVALANARMRLRQLQAAQEKQKANASK
jgi:hypothetical protein